MIKRLRFADDPDWRDAISAAVDAPEDVRPVRVAASTVVAAPGDEPARHLGVAEEWFVDAAHLRRFESWRLVGEDAGDDVGPVVVADAVVLRGADWLERRWIDGGPKVKHMALAMRAPGLTPAEFSARWRDHAGRASAASGTTAIPDDVRGLAYVQDHPLAGEGAPAYDAVNEVSFDDLDALQRRVDWFRDNEIGRVPDGLFGVTHFLAVREEVVSLNRD